MTPAAHAAGPPAATTLADAAQEFPVYLEVRLNSSPPTTPLPFVQRQGRILARVATLRQLGFALPDHDGDTLLEIAKLPGVVVRFDASLQQLAIDAPLALLALDTTSIRTRGEYEVVEASNTPGMLLNYDFYASADSGSRNVTAFAELRGFGLGDGVFSQTAVSRAFQTDGGPWQGDSVRLDSSWRWSAPESMFSVTVGDTLSGNLPWSRAVRMGGIRFGRDFSLQPYRMTTPLPSFLGEVAVPSSVELYVDGLKQYSGEVPVGPFQLTATPSINGLGNAQLLVTDAFGRTRSLDFAFYSTQQLLTEGLSDWSMALGVVRESYGVRSFDYGEDPIGSASLRYGLSDRLTVETHAEAGAGIANAGAGAVWSLGRVGVVNASLAHGRQQARDGWQHAVGYHWSNGRFNFAVDSQRTHGDYRDIASRYGQAPALASERALIGWSSAAAGSFNLSYVRLQYPESDASRYASVNWNHSVGGRWAFNLSLNQNLGADDERSLFAGVSYSFDDGVSVNTSLQRNAGRNDAVLDVSRPVPGDGGYGWRLQARAGDAGDGGLAEAGWLTQAGRYQLGAAHQGGRGYGYASASGGLVWMGGHAFASRNIGDAFAVVSTEGVGGVPVKLENRSIGITNDDGMLLVTPLNAWERNKLSIDPMDLPADMRVPRVDLQATPTDRAGTLVRFEVTPVRAAIVVLHDASGQPLPLGSTVRLLGSDAGAIVGYDGETYLDALQTDNLLQVQTAEGACRVEFVLPAEASGVQRIGPLQCLAGGVP